MIQVPRFKFAQTHRDRHGHGFDPSLVSESSNLKSSQRPAASEDSEFEVQSEPVGAAGLTPSRESLLQSEAPSRIAPTVAVFHQQFINFDFS
jgi:hypothetical protein